MAHKSLESFSVNYDSVVSWNSHTKAKEKDIQWKPKTPDALKAKAAVFDDRHELNGHCYPMASIWDLGF
jgi:hypothetical protein